jgi:hypothetical protein
MTEPITVGLDIELRSRGRSFVEVGPWYDNRAGATVKIREYVRVPFTVIRGVEEGSTLVVTAGTHPTEYAGIGAAIRLSNEVKPEDLKGRLIVVPVVNLPGFWARSYLCPIDGVNVADSYRMGGRSDGTIGELIAYKIVTEILSKADYHLDLHGTDTSESCVPFSMFTKIGDSTIDTISEGMARALGIELSDYIRVYVKSRPAQSPGITPIPKASCEVGQGDKLLPELSSAVFQGVLNVMRYLKMIDVSPRKKEYTYVAASKKITLNQDGLFYLRVNLGDIVEKGQIIGEIENLEGDVIETLRSPVRGLVSFMIHNPVVRAGEKLVSIDEL